ncbi:MAG TPA: ABC transporter substrate-binding protein [Chloroflexota bacterium]|nr:ABC transporter substrate-binding protein [Chloroflexota bacterium]
MVRFRFDLALRLAAALTLSALVFGSTATAQTADKIRLQIKWVPQAQFAGYFVAQDKGFYADENLDVTIVPGGPDIIPEQQVTNGQADFGVDWVASFLAFRDKGLPIVDVAQIYQSSGLMLISKKSANIKSPQDLLGRNVGVWYGGNEFEFLALMDKLHYDPDKDLNVIKQGFTMDPFLAGQMEAASAMTYNEYQIVLESGVNPDDLNVIRYNDQGVGMLEDNLFATEDMVSNKPDLVQRFVRASLKGWQSAIDDQAGAVATVMKYVEPGSTTADHQTRMMAEVAKLVMPPGTTADQIGVMDAGRFQTTADIAYKFHVINTPADPAKSYTNAFVGGS